MDVAAGQVAVITGGAAGIGRSLAKQCVAEGMRVVLADVESDVLAATAAALREQGGEVLEFVCDVSDADQVEALAQAAIGRFGAVHLLFNNAGVSGGMNSWASTLNDWHWVIGVNLMGVVHGIRSFVPHMLAHGEAAHIVNTASIAGLISGSSMAAYRTTKHAVVALSETLYLDLQRQEAPIGVSVLCPAWVRTGIAESGRNRPNNLQNATPGAGFTAHDVTKAGAVQQLVAGGTDPDDVAHKTFDAIRAGQFYILPHPEMKPVVSLRMKSVLNGTNPVDPW